REQRVAAVAFFVVAVVLIAVDDDFVSHFPAAHLRTTSPNDSRSIGAGDMERMFVDVERRDRDTNAGPYAVVVDAAAHHADQALAVAERPRRQHLGLHTTLRRTMTPPAESPSHH